MSIERGPYQDHSVEQESAAAGGWSQFAYIYGEMVFFCRLDHRTLEKEILFNIPYPVLSTHYFCGFFCIAERGP